MRNRIGLTILCVSLIFHMFLFVFVDLIRIEILSAELHSFWFEVDVHWSPRWIFVGVVAVAFLVGVVLTAVPKLDCEEDEKGTTTCPSQG